MVCYASDGRYMKCVKLTKYMTRNENNHCQVHYTQTGTHTHTHNVQNTMRKIRTLRWLQLRFEFDIRLLGVALANDVVV